MTAVDDLVTWLRAQLDDDERVALGAYPNVWQVEETRHHEFLIVPDHFPSTPAVARTAENAEHIARWDPARVLAEVDAKRRILDEYKQAKTYYDLHRDAPAGEVHGLLTAIRLLALLYADRPGYRDEWRP